MSDEDGVMPIYVAINVTLAEVTPWRGKETLGHDGYGRNVRVPWALTRAGTYGTARTEQCGKPKA
jgi:hypothetical protein